MEVFDRGIRLKELRKSANLTQKDLAKRLEVHVSTISNYENNTQEPPITTFEYLANLYGVSIDYLVGRDNNEIIQLNKYSGRDKRILKSLAKELDNLE